MKFQLKMLFVVLQLVISASLFAGSGDPDPPLLWALDHSDIVIHGTVKKAIRHEAVPGPSQGRALREEYSVLQLRGSVAMRDGPQLIRGNYLLRVADYWTHDQVFAEGTEAIFFIDKNGERYNPIVVTLPIINGQVHHNNRPVVISGNETLEPVPEYNQCALEDYHAIYNAEEDLDLVFSFTCADGSQWNRGNDAPPNARIEGFSADEFLQAVGDFMTKYNYPNPDIRKGLGQPSRAVLKKSNLLDDPEIMEWDKRVAEVLNTLGKNPETLSENIVGQVEVMRFIERELARGKPRSELPQVVQDVHLPVYDQQRLQGSNR